MRKVSLKGILVSLWALALPGVLLAQSAQVGTLAGQVKDETGAALPGVAIHATHQQMGFSRDATTDTTGRFLFAQAQLGPYRVVVSLSGFGTITLTDNLVESNKRTELPITMKLAGQAAEIVVTGDVPIVDKTNQQVETRIREKEFQKLPIGRSYLTVLGQAPGVVGTVNPNVHGALTGNNQYLIDGVDTTDTTTGTFAANLNFEAVQEVGVFTAGLSAEYGRAAGGIISVITKSGTNRFEGSAKFIAVNDKWNQIESTHSQVCTSGAVSTRCEGASLARTKFAHTNPDYALTVGGPVWKDHAWFFGAYERAENLSPQRQTVDSRALLNFQQKTIEKAYDVRVTGQLTPNMSLWVKAQDDPIDGFVIDYWNGTQVPALAGDLHALTTQNQTGGYQAAQWTGVFGANFTAEALYSQAKNRIDVVPFSPGPLDNSAPHRDNSTFFWYNGGAFDGFVSRPRKQVTVAGTYYAELGGNSHSFKAGFDWQNLESTNNFAYPNNQRFFDASFNPVTGVGVPFQRVDYDPPVASTSKGDIYSVYARDKFELGKMLFFEIGARFEHQTGSSDIGAKTVNANTVSPRFAGTFDVTGNGKTLVVGTYSRVYQFITQTFSNNFGQNVQRGAFNTYNWNGTAYVFASRTVTGGSSTPLNADIKPASVDEGTLGFKQQIGNAFGVGLVGIYRKWNNIIDDTIVYDASNSQFQQFVNYDPAQRKFYGAELTLEKRFSGNWNALVSYTYSKTKGNNFADTGSTLGDFSLPSYNCRTTVDPTIGTSGVLPCDVVQNGANKYGNASYDRPHVLKFNGAYTAPLGPVNLTAGIVGIYRSGDTFQQQRSMNVILPGTNSNGATVTYFYDQRGNERLPSLFQLDFALEATYRIVSSVELGFKGEVFNVTNSETQVTANNVNWCNDTSATASVTCTNARNTFGTATARGSFQTPRNYRLTALVRF